MKPKYATELIVGIINEGTFNWYILRSDICILDLNVLEDAYKKKGYNFTIYESYRFGIRVVDEKTKDMFLDKIKQFIISTDELKKMMTDEKDSNALLGYNPSILIDFDKRILLSYYPESESYEEYVPKDWKERYQYFQDIIPSKFRYWEY